MNKKFKLNLNAGDYASNHCDGNKTYDGREVYKMLCNAYIAGNNDTLDEYDEDRIRKEIIDLVRHSINCMPAYKFKERIAWLEKQASYTAIVETGNGGINALVTLPTEMKSAEESLGIDSDTYNKIVDECIFGEQKHVWSEDDEELLKWSINNLTELKDRFGEEYGKVGKCIDWVKSLRPQSHWKPSDEQLNDLKKAIDSFTFETDYLQELYEDLSRLKMDKS